MVAVLAGAVTSGSFLLIGACGATKPLQSVTSSIGQVGSHTPYPRRFDESTTVLPPLNSYPGSPAELMGISCSKASDCVAAGYYFVASGKTEPMIAAETKGAWRRSVEIASPANALGACGQTPCGAALTGVGCWAVDDCLAVGHYTSSSRRDEIMAVIEVDGNWGRATELSIPGNAAPPIPSGTWDPGITCISPSSCAVVSTYSDRLSGHSRGMVVSYTHGVWRPAIELPAVSSSSDEVVDAIACVSTGDCVVTGAENGRSSEVTESHGRWGRPGTIMTPPASVSVLYGVSCVLAGYCVAVGSYARSPRQDAMATTENRGQWGRGTRIATAAQSPAGTLSPALFSVSCASVGNCVAVGDLTTYGTDGIGGPFSSAQVDGRWSSGEVIPLPIDASTTQLDAKMASVSCTRTGSCVAVGTYDDKSHHVQGMAASTS